MRDKHWLPWEKVAHSFILNWLLLTWRRCQTWLDFRAGVLLFSFSCLSGSWHMGRNWTTSTSFRRRPTCSTLWWEMQFLLLVLDQDVWLDVYSESFPPSPWLSPVPLWRIWILAAGNCDFMDWWAGSFAFWISDPSLDGTHTPALFLDRRTHYLQRCWL